MLHYEANSLTSVWFGCNLRSSAGVMFFLVSLFTFCICFTELVELPLVSWMRKCSTTEQTRPQDQEMVEGSSMLRWWCDKVQNTVAGRETEFVPR